LTKLLIDLNLIRDHSASAEKLAAGIAEFETYIRNNQESIPNYGERYRRGETISTAFVESTINQVGSRRFVKKHQMHWTLRGGHLPCKPGRKFSMRNWKRCSVNGTRCSESKRKRRAPGFLMLCHIGFLSLGFLVRGRILTLQLLPGSFSYSAALAFQRPRYLVCQSRAAATRLIGSVLAARR
jgi:hypothetical protein